MFKKSTTTIKIQGKEYNFSFNFGVLKLMQKHKKKLKMQEIFEKISEQDLEIIGLLVYCGVKINHSELKISDIDEMSLTEFTEVFTVVGELISETMPEVTEDEKK